MNLAWGAAGAFVLCMALGLLGGKLFHFEGPTLYLFMGVMGALGLGVAGILLYFQERRQKKKEAEAGGAEASPAAGGGGSDVDQWIREANARLTQSKGGATIANLPMLFVIGDRGTAKTSSILNSGLEPELLTGQVYQQNVVTPTRGANIFFARDTVLVEAGGALIAQPGNWKTLVARLQPGRLKSLMGGGGQAPRGVMLCFDLESFTRAGAADALANAARYLHERLGEISQVLGISFPVYVLFTRTDRLPFFADYVRNLTHDEAGQVVGVTLPLRPAVQGGVYAEEETQRLTAAFNQLGNSFCDQRLHLLPRETDAERIPGAYEFPREFRKLRATLVQFLVDIARPSQLRVSPFLRGFYFSGVRVQEVRDTPASPLEPASPAQTEPVSGGATSIFRAGVLQERRAQQASAQSAGGMRRVPQWLFLTHLFHDVILADRAARAASGSSVKTSMTKRILLASAAGLCLFYIIMLLVSYSGNRSLQDNAMAAARGIGVSEAAGSNLASEDSLRRLEALRQSLATLTGYQVNGAPFSLRWGLYSGADMLPHVRKIYYNKFRQLLFGSTQDQLLATLRRSPAMPGPNDDYGSAYDTLKAYLLTTGEWKRSSETALQAFLGTRLRERWSNGRDNDIGAARMDLARRQFDFYAGDLQHGNPYSMVSDSPAVDRSRQYLARFSGAQRVYQYLLGQAEKGHPVTTFNQSFTGTGEVVTSTVPVKFAYTRDGAKFMLDQIKRQNFGGEAWVLGANQGQSADQGSMEKGILDLYVQDYVKQWRSVVTGSRVSPYASYEDASNKLNRLTQADAPLLHLFAWVSDNTALDNLPDVVNRFRTVQALVPPGSQNYISPAAQPYNQGLIALQSAVARYLGDKANGERPLKDSQESARNIAKGLAGTLPPDKEAQLEKPVSILLQEPITNLDSMAPPVTGDGKSFCTAVSALTTKFPFNPLAQPEVTLDELGAILKPKTGRLWTFYEASAKNILQCQNGECTAKGKVNPEFVRFMSQMMKFSRALYGEAGTEPTMRYTLRPLPNDRVDEFVITVNGQVTRLKANASQTFTWPGMGTPDFSLKPGGDYGLSWPGIWGLFRFFADADIRTPSGPNTFGWNLRQGVQNRVVLTYSFYADTNGGPAVFSKDFLSTLRCVVPVTR